MAIQMDQFVRVASRSEVEKNGCTVVHTEGATLVLIPQDGTIYALDNRCPHMGFPLHRGSIHDGILTCHWHHARFDITSGGTFDQFADDVPSFPVEIRGDDIYVNIARRANPREHYLRRLEDGLELQIPLVVAKAVIGLMEGNGDGREPFKVGLQFGARYRQDGWGQGLTMLTAFQNMLPALDTEDRPRAIYLGIGAVARETAGSPPRFAIDPLPSNETDIPTLKRWFRRFVEVRNSDGAERTLVSAIRAGADHRQMADMLFAAVTDHRYLSIGHVADFTNKAFEALDHVGWEHAEEILPSLVGGYTRATRAEESDSWRNPIDLIALLSNAFISLTDALKAGEAKRGTWQGREALAWQILGDDPEANFTAMLDALREGATEVQLAEAVSYAAALRIARFHTSNEFGDWDTVLHTFSFSNAIHMGMRRAPSVELLRGVFDAAASVYLDRFLNTPAAQIPQAGTNGTAPELLLPAFLEQLNKQQQVNEAASLVARYLSGGGDPKGMIATVGKALLREDRDFHTIQSVEAAFRLYGLLQGSESANNVLIAAARYLAAHSPTVRAQGQTYNIAARLSRGEHLYEDD